MEKRKELFLLLNFSYYENRTTEFFFRVDFSKGGVETRS